MPWDLFADDLSTLGNDELFAAIEEFAENQPVEGWRHDYAVEWSDSALTKVAAFAHTFGGLLIVGVKKEKGDAVCELLGVESEVEYKTRIASSVAANISPVPPYGIFECYRPGAPDRRFCLVRVRESKALHLVTKKGLYPVYIRNEDETRIADAAQLRRLIDREKEAPFLTQKITEQAYQLQKALQINYGYQNPDSDAWYLSTHSTSVTGLKLEIIPVEAIPLELDKSHEDKLDKLIADLYPRFFRGDQEDVVRLAKSRHASFYQRSAYHKNLDYEGTWRVTEMGEIGHATQMRYESPGSGKVWSVVDLARYIILFVLLARRWWEFISYFGEAYLYAQLSVDGLRVLRHPHGYYIHAFDPTYPASRSDRLDIRSDAISLESSTRNDATAERIKLTYLSDGRDSVSVVTSLLNQLLRSLGHSVDRELLEGSIESLIPD